MNSYGSNVIIPNTVEKAVGSSSYDCLFWVIVTLVCLGLLALCFIQSNKASRRTSEAGKEDGLK